MNAGVASVKIIKSFAQHPHLVLRSAHREKTIGNKSSRMVNRDRILHQVDTQPDCFVDNQAVISNADSFDQLNEPSVDKHAS